MTEFESVIMAASTAVGVTTSMRYMMRCGSVSCDLTGGGPIIGHQNKTDVANIEICIAKCNISYRNAELYASGMCHSQRVSTNNGNDTRGFVKKMLMLRIHPRCASAGATPIRIVSGNAHR